MVESKHTPGPWVIGTRPDGGRWFSIGDTRTGPHFQADIFCSEADARLIAAAPELLEMLVELNSRVIFDGTHGLDRVFKGRVEAVLAKAGVE